MKTLTHYSGTNWYLARLKRMPRKVSKQAVVHFILSLSNNPVPMEIDQALEIFDKAMQTGAIVKVGPSWQGNPNWKP